MRWCFILAVDFVLNWRKVRDATVRRVVYRSIEEPNEAHLPPYPKVPIHRLWLGNILAVTGAEEHGAAKSDLSALIPRHSIVSPFKFLTGTSDGPRTGGEMHPSTKFQPCSTLGSLNLSLFGLPAPAYG